MWETRQPFAVCGWCLAVAMTSARRCAGRARASMATSARCRSTTVSSSSRTSWQCWATPTHSTSFLMLSWPGESFSSTRASPVSTHRRPTRAVPEALLTSPDVLPLLQVSCLTNQQTVWTDNLFLRRAIFAKSIQNASGGLLSKWLVDFIRILFSPNNKYKEYFLVLVHLYNIILITITPLQQSNSVVKWQMHNEHLMVAKTPNYTVMPIIKNKKQLRQKNTSGWKKKRSDLDIKSTTTM